MPRKKKLISKDGNSISTSLDIKTEEFKQKIEEYVDSKPVINPNATTDNLTMLKYNGDNAKQIMDFCGAYHIDAGHNRLVVYVRDKGSSVSRCYILNANQSLVKDHDVFKVVD